MREKIKCSQVFLGCPTAYEVFVKVNVAEIYLALLGVYLTERTIKLLGERCPH